MQGIDFGTPFAVAPIDLSSYKKNNNNKEDSPSMPVSLPPAGLPSPPNTYR